MGQSSNDWREEAAAVGQGCLTAVMALLFVAFLVALVWYASGWGFPGQ